MVKQVNKQRMSRVRSYNELLHSKKKKDIDKKKRERMSKNWSNKVKKNFQGLSSVFVKKKNIYIYISSLNLINNSVAIQPNGEGKKK